jgi:MtN3 and saliva related transmembrane protein
MTEAPLFTWIGYAAGTLTTLAFAPQVLHVWKTRRAQDLHLGTLLAFAVGVILWLAYGLLTRQRPVILANAITLVLQLALLVLKLRYGRTATVERK